jgi:hypothetical protein
MHPPARCTLGASRTSRATSLRGLLEDLEPRLLLNGLISCDAALLPAIGTAVPSTVRVVAANGGKASEFSPAGNGHITFTRTGVTTLPLAVNFDLSGTATADDYLPLPASITIPAHKSSFTLDLVPVDDTIAEIPETVILTLRPDAAYAIDSARSSATVTLADNEPAVKITASGKPSEIDPAGKGKIRLTISRSGGTLTLPLDIHLTLYGAAAPGVNFTAPPDPITIPAGKKSVTLDLPVIPDTQITGPQSATFALAASSAYHVDPRKNAATVAIADDEPYIDLCITSATVCKSLNLAIRTSKVSVSVSASNLGTVAAAPLPLRLSLVDITDPGHTVDLGTISFSKGVSPGKTVKAAVTVPLSVLPSAPTPGSYHLKVVADNAALTPVELDASDNALTSTGVMQVYNSTVTASTLRFNRKTVTDDSKMIGGTAATYLVPAGWNFTGSVFWRVNPTAPASLSVKVTNPTNLDALEIFPPGQFINGPGLGTGLFPNGSLYYGNEVQPTPANVLAMITQIVIPRLRPNITYTVVSQQETPLYATAVRTEYPADSASTTTTVTAGRVRIEYDVVGQTVEEDFYCALSIMHMNNVGITYWGADRPLALRAAKGQLDSHSALLQAIAQSETIDLRWYNKYLQLLQIMLNVQLQNIQSAGQLSQYISQTTNEILDSSMAAYQARAAAEDQIHESFIQYINDVDTYYDPYDDRTFEFPSGYQDAWVNSLGDYLLSDNVNFNPNVSLSGTWKKLTPQ